MTISTLNDLLNILIHYPNVLKYYILNENESDVLYQEYEIIDFVQKEGERDLKYVSIDYNEEGLVVDVELY